MSFTRRQWRQLQRTPRFRLEKCRLKKMGWSFNQTASGSLRGSWWATNQSLIAKCLWRPQQQMQITTRLRITRRVPTKWRTISHTGMPTIRRCWEQIQATRASIHIKSQCMAFLCRISLSTRRGAGQVLAYNENRLNQWTERKTHLLKDLLKNLKQGLSLPSRGQKLKNSSLPKIFRSLTKTKFPYKSKN